MSLDVVNAAASVATLLVLVATVAVAIVQLRHLRAGNELEAVLAIEHDFRSAAFQAALTYVRTELPARMRDPAYREALRRPGYLDPRRHPEMTICNWFNVAGTLIEAGFLNEELFLASFGKLVEYSWDALAPVVALLRSSRGSGQYDSFEYLSFQARRRSARRARRGAANVSTVADPWLAVDGGAE